MFAWINEEFRIDSKVPSPFKPRFQIYDGIISIAKRYHFCGGDHFGGGDHFDGGDHFGGGTGRKKMSMLKNKSTTISYGLHAYQRSDVKMFKSLQWHHSPAVGGSTVRFEHVDVITMVDKSIPYTKENCCGIFKCIS